MGYIYSPFQKQAQNRLLILTHRKIIVIGPTELKLWAFKDGLFNGSISVKFSITVQHKYLNTTFCLGNLCYIRLYIELQYTYLPEYDLSIILVLCLCPAVAGPGSGPPHNLLRLHIHWQ